MGRRHIIILLVTALILTACAAEDEQPAAPVTPTEAPAEPTATATAAATATAQPTAPTIQEDETTGRLYYIGYVNQQQHLLTLDLVTSEETSLFAVPGDAWLSEVAVSPDGQQLLLAYSPSPEQSQAQFGFTALYVMPADASAEPELLIPQEDPSESFFNISWPLDNTIYFAHVAPTIDESGAVLYTSQVKRAYLPDGNVEALANDAAWPRLSNDGTRLAYVTEDGDLMLSAADGSSPTVLLGLESFAAVDAPLFSHDDSQLYFSAVDLEPVASLSLLDRLMGVQLAHAHSVPSDWWRLPLDVDSAAERLTSIGKIGLYGDFDDDERRLYFVAADGVYVMDPDGLDLTQLAAIPTVPTIDWTP